LERLQSSMAQFEKDLTAAITVTSESLSSVLHQPQQREPEAIGTLDTVIRDCERVLQ
jgi:hypothetical protein